MTNSAICEVIREPLDADAFVARLRAAGEEQYHHRHPFHVLMHSGGLTPHQLQQWVINRYYYQTRIPIKDALVLAKSQDPAFRRLWVRRILEQDGTGDDPGGLSLWLQLAEGVGLDPHVVAQCRHVLPGVRTRVRSIRRTGSGLAAVGSRGLFPHRTFCTATHVSNGSRPGNATIHGSRLAAWTIFDVACGRRIVMPARR